MKSAPAALAALALASASLPAAPADVRTGPLKDLNGYFPFSPPSSTETWQTRRATLQLQTQIALGLHPLPQKTPLNPSIDGRITGDGFTVERVRFESFPGFFVTGSLFRPTTPSPNRNPAVLCPHGHWNNGRFLSEPENEVTTSIQKGAEAFQDNARSPLQARCITLARMGCTVFFYDMIGYADSIQLSYELAHRFKTQRPAMNDPENWGFFSPQAEGHLHSIMGLQTWNSIRALDFLASLPEVDPARIGVTGASGGGTQTFILGAIDPRPAALFPCVMVSTAMQGGCTCENASLLRIDTGNVELAALFAPKPLGMTSANDWTREMNTKGFPQLQQLYSLLGKPDHVMLHDRTEFGHNYNLPSRMAMYRWFATHLQTPRPAPETEAPIQYLSQNDLTVWTSNHASPKPDDASLERQILQHWHKDTSRQIAANPQLVTDALPTIVGRSWPHAGLTTWEQGERSQQNGYLEMKGHIVNSTHKEAVAATFLYPTAWNGTVKVLLQSPDPATAASTAQAGTAICFPTLFTEPAPGTPATARHVEGDRDFAGYTHGYNHSVLKRRAHDILTTLAFISSHERKPSRIEVHAAGDFVPETALALALVPPSAVASASFADTSFRFADIKDIRSPKLVPGILRYGDLPALLAKAKR